MTEERKTLERPLTPRSVVASLLLGMHPPRLAGSRLVRWCGLFGIAPGTARVALSRMVDRGELVAQDGVYELAGRVRGRQPAQEWSLAPDLLRWQGRWAIAVVDAGARPATERAALRDAMRRLRYGEEREGVWVRPDNLPDAAAPADAWAIARSQCSWWRGEPEADAAERAELLFAPKAWARRAEQLTPRLRRVTESLTAGTDSRLADGFVVGAAVLAHVRADPLLPAELCPSDWPGADLRGAYAAYQGAFASAVRDWFRGDA